MTISGLAGELSHCAGDSASTKTKTAQDFSCAVRLVFLFVLEVQGGNFATVSPTFDLHVVQHFKIADIK